MLKKNMLYIGIIFLLIGLAAVFLNPDQQQANLEIARHATNAQAAAQAISANNQRHVYYRPGACHDNRRLYRA